MSQLRSLTQQQQQQQHMRQQTDILLLYESKMAPVVAGSCIDLRSLQLLQHSIKHVHL
jgi:hypothetical protein